MNITGSNDKEFESCCPHGRHSDSGFCCDDSIHIRTHATIAKVAPASNAAAAKLIPCATYANVVTMMMYE